MGRPGQGAVGIDYGKIKLYSTQDDMDKLFEKLELIMNKWGYPEEDGKEPTDLELKDRLEDDDLPLENEDDDVEDMDEPGSKPAPWEVAKRGRTQQ